MTLPTAEKWQDLVKATKATIKEMKEKPELNHNQTIATYGLTAKIPDDNFLNDIVKLHSAAILDAL